MKRVLCYLPGMAKLFKFLANRARRQSYLLCVHCLMPFRVTALEERYYAKVNRPLPELCVRCRAEERKADQRKLANQ